MHEGSLTRCRHERKMALAPELARLVEGRCGLALVPETRVTSIYFDTADAKLTTAALRSPDHCLKVRTKEYDPDKGSPGEPRCVVELKRRRGTVTYKRRFWVLRNQLSSIFGNGEEPLGKQARAARFATLRAGPGPLHPILAVTYTRRVCALGDALRITFDHALAFHVAPAALLLGAEPLTHPRLPPPFAREARVIVELKYLGDCAPAWAAPLLAAHEDGFSKLGAALALIRESGVAPAHATV